MGSTRLPGKSLLPFAGTTVLGHLVERLQAVARLDVVVLTSELPEDDAVARAADALGVPVHRGPAEDVLARFAGWVEGRIDPSRPVLRVCADRPLLCPGPIDELLDAWDELGAPDYLANNAPPSYPKGLDLELVRAGHLVTAHRESDDPYDREHVTPFVYRRPERFRLENLVCPFGNWSHVELALDTGDDLRRLRALHELLPSGYDLPDVLTAVELSA